jgi:hypothetical protein
MQCTHESKVGVFIPGCSQFQPKSHLCFLGLTRLTRQLLKTMEGNGGIVSGETPYWRAGLEMQRLNSLLAVVRDEYRANPLVEDFLLYRLLLVLPHEAFIPRDIPLLGRSLTYLASSMSMPRACQLTGKVGNGLHPPGGVDPPEAPPMWRL